MLNIVLPERPRLLEPGMWRQDPYLERYEVPGGGSIIIELLPDDVLVIIDPEGKQVGELAAFSPKGKPDTSALSTGAVTPATNLQSILNGPEESARQVSAGLKRRGIDIGSAEAVALFDHDTPSGEQTTFTADRQVTCILSAPGGKMIVDEQTPPTPLLAWIHRSQKRLLSSPALPEPLADPKQDFLVKACTASSFTVKVGEFIQIIDVSGRECSDFLAFSKAQLDNGLERGLDLTTTRTLTGTGYPGPGLFSKFFDQDMQPLLEVVRDTCGRHDTFGLACASKYYEEQGYFGHPNCSDNLSKAIEGYGIRARRGWPAINFFYNTNIDEQNVLYGDEPWSRPGDYVLLKALTDLVCASSACPDDISAANGWNPTDIHVRVYAPSNVFSKAVAYRMTPNDETRLTKETGFHPRTSALTRNIAEYRGYWLPTSYNNRGAIDEYWACREKAVMIDLSPLRKFEVLGPDAEVLLQHVLTRNVRRLAVGQVVYSAMCYPHGGMLDDGTLLRLGPDNFRWIGGDDYGGLWMREEAKRLGYRVWIKSSTNQLHNIAVQGPASRDILKDIVWTPPSQTRIDELEWFRFTIGRVRDLNGIPIMISRTGYTGELGFEIFCHPKDAVTVWDAVWKAGQSRGVSPMGLDALDMVRIESGLVFSGYEFSDQTDPFESGIGFTVPLKTKEDHFVGREALVERKNKPQRKLVGLEMEGNEPGAHGDCVHVEHGRAQVGVVTSATRSPILRKNIALARLDVTHAETGTYVEIGKLDGHQKRIPAVVVPLPFYDPKKERVRA